MNINKLIEKADQAFKKRNYDYAITVLMEAISFAPNNRKARELLRKSSLKKHEQNYPNSIMVGIFGIPKRIGMFFAGLGKKTNPEAYMMACERFLMLDPKNKNVNIALGDAAAIGNHVDAAIVAFETASEFHPEDVEALKRLGNLYWRNGEIQRAHETFTHAVELDPKDQDAIKARKNVAAEASLTQTGFETAGSSRDLVKDKEEATELERGQRIQQTEDDLTGQRNKIDEKLAADSENVELLQDLAEIALKQKEWVTAITALEKAVANKPGDMAIEFALGDARVIQAQQKQYEAQRDGNKTAADELKKELDTLQAAHLAAKVIAYPTDLNLRFELGEVHLRRGEHQDAIAEFQQTVRDPKFKNDSQLRMGQAFAAADKLDLAVRQLEQALEAHSTVNDRAKEILYTLAGIQEKRGDSKAAKDHYDKIYEVDIGYLDVGDRLAKLDSTTEEGKLSLD
jgi:tetratricopeptide (TPR) repeat protein